MKNNKKQIRYIFMNGRGSSGKDTQADLLLKEMPQAERISTGDIVRGSQNPESPYFTFHHRLQPYMETSKQGGFIPDTVMLSIVQEVVLSYLNKGKDTFIFTGFPRTLDQLYAVDKGALVPKGYGAQNDFLCLAVLEGQSRGRAATRRDIAHHDGKEIRSDDKPEVVENRLKVYRENTLPMLSKLSHEGRLKIIKSNGTIQEVHERVKTALGLSKPSLGERLRKKLL